MKCNECALWVEQTIRKGRTIIKLGKGSCLLPHHDYRLITREHVRCSRGITEQQLMFSTLRRQHGPQEINLRIQGAAAEAAELEG